MLSKHSFYYFKLLVTFTEDWRTPLLAKGTSGEAK